VAITAEQFGKALTASTLMTADEVRALWSALSADERPKDGASFAKLLVEQKKLTSFQAAELLAGRGARLSMGEYVLLAEIGAGGMGQVYKARHRRMKRFVALKVMSSAAMRDQAAVKRFQREVYAAARLEHPNIVTAYDSGESGDVKYLVMQFVDGGDLSDLVKKQGALPIDAAVDYIVQAAQGLAYAHSEGVVHRDIKPANLLLDRQGVVKILDMGLARIEGGDDGLTATEQVMGTVDYMSPEQAADTKHADARADIYSLGCTLWYLLTGKKVYESDSMIGRLMAHRNDPLPSLVKTRDDAPWPLEQAFHKMIAKRPQDRHQSMDEVIAALLPFAGDRGSGSGGERRSGSSAGLGSNAELASFMQAMGTGPTNTGPTNPGASGKTVGGLAATAAKSSSGSKTMIGAHLDATQHFNKGDTDTDPKSALAAASLPHSAPKDAAASQARTQPKSGGSSGPAKNVKWIAGAVVGAMLLAVGIFVKLRAPVESAVAESNPRSGTNVAGGATVAATPTLPTPIAAVSTTPRPSSLPAQVDSSFEVERRSAELLNAKFRVTLASPDGKTWIVAPGGTLPSEWFRITRIARESASEFVSTKERDETLLPLFERLTRLEELIDGANRLGLDAASLERLAKAPCGRSLRSLVLGNAPNSQIVAALERFPQLDSVRLVATSITDPGVMSLKQLPARIKRLAFYDFNKTGHLTDVGFKAIAEIPALDFVFENSDSAFDAKMFAALAAHPELRSITFRNSAPQFNFGDKELAELGKSRSLRLLDLHPPKRTQAITDVAVRVLASNMPRCTFLWSGGVIIARKADRFHTPKPGEVVDLLSLIDPEVHAQKGRWTKEGTSLLTSSELDPCLLELPVEPAPAFRLEATVEHVSGIEGMGFAMPVGAGEVRLIIDGYRGTGIRSGLDQIDGKRANEIPGAYDQPVFTADRPTHIVLDVAPDHIVAACNGITIVDWRGEAHRLTIPDRAKIDYRIPPKTISVLAYRPQYRITKLTYTAKSD